MPITVCHLPPGTSKWNKIEHRLFSHITMNWRGRPLTSHEVIVNSIAATTTRTGLAVRAELDLGSYPTGIEISDAQMAAIPLVRNRFHGDWNYTIHPRPTPSAPATGTAEPSQLAGGAPGRFLLSHPALTGMSRGHLDDLVTELAGPQEAQREQARHQQARRRTPSRSRGGPAPQAHQCRPDPGHSALPAQTLHASSPEPNCSPSTAAGSPRPSAKSARSWRNTGTPSRPRPPGSPHRQTWPPSLQPKTMTNQKPGNLRVNNSQALTAWCAIRLLGHSGCLRRVGPGNVSGRAERS